MSTIDSNKEVSGQSTIEADEAKKIVESITDSITGGEKQERELIPQLEKSRFFILNAYFNDYFLYN